MRSFSFKHIMPPHAAGCSSRLGRLLRDSFRRDVAILLIISIVLGAASASAVSLAANAYFSQTLSSLVGDYGEYDLIIQVREEMKDDSQVHLGKIIDEVFPGARLKEGPTIAGKTAFFIALPDKYKTRQIYDDLPKTFGGVPGGASVGVMTEPRLTIRGVPEGAKPMLFEKIAALDGVRFVFHDGASIGVIMTGPNKIQSVSQGIKNILNNYQVIEISFPVGSEPANPIRMGDTIAEDLRSGLKLEYAENVSVDGKNEDITYMVSTMLELKRFLAAYASKVKLIPLPGAELAKGDTIVFQGGAATPPAAGKPPDRENVLVRITGAGSGQTFEGMIMQGDAAQLGAGQGFKLHKGVVGPAAATATVYNPRQALAQGLGEGAKLFAEAPGFVQTARDMDHTAAQAIDNYSNAVSALRQTLARLEAAGGAIQTATGHLAGIDTTALQSQLDSSSKAIGGLIGTMRVVSLLGGDSADTINSLTAAQRNLASLKASLATLDRVGADARQAKRIIDNIVDSGQAMLASLAAFDVNEARRELADADQRLAEAGKVNMPLLGAQLEYLKAAIPNYRDEEIYHSLALLDKFIAGQVIPGARIQILTTSGISAQAIAPIVQRDTGVVNASLYSTALGVIEPNPRGELYQVLSEVRATLAGLTSMVMVILFLVLDHTVIMTIVRRRRKNLAPPAARWRRIASRLAAALFAPERRYGMAVGAFMLTGMFLLSRGGIPYLPWSGVPAIGAVLGLIVAVYAERISPVAMDEVMAGEALGLSFDQIMREIVVPAGRPGLLQKLNRRKVKFK